MNKNLVLFVAGIMLVATVKVNAQDFDAENFSDELKTEIATKVEDGNKLQTVCFQTYDGQTAAFEASGFFIGAYGGFRHIDGSHHGLFSLSIAYEGMPLYKRGEKELPDGRTVRNYRNPFSVEFQLSCGNREYVDCVSQGKYFSYEGVAYLKWRFPGFDKWTNDRLSLNTLFGLGVVYSRYDDEPEGVFVHDGNDLYQYKVGTDGFGAVGQLLSEIRWRPSKQLATAVLIRGGITTVPGVALNEVWTSFRFVGQIGIQIPLCPNHRVVTPIAEL